MHLPLKSYDRVHLWCDRRSGFDRRQGRDRRSQSGQPRGKDQRSHFQRRQRERRYPEDPEIIEYRRARTRLREQLQAYPIGRRSKRRVAGGITVLVSILLGALVLLFLFPFGNMIHCKTSPRPGVDWSNCLLLDGDFAAANLTGADLHNSSLEGADLQQALLRSAVLSYANLAFTNLRNADLSGALLRGANLRGADLNQATLDYADLSYADLSGANLEKTSFKGTKLGYAVWSNRRECAPDSISICQ